MHPERKKVLRIGSLPIESKPFDERGLSLTPIALDQVRASGDSACGIVIAELVTGRIGLMRSWFDLLKSAAEDFDLAIVVLVSSADEFQVVRRLSIELGVQDRTTVFPIKEVGYAAQNIYQWNPGPPSGKPKILTSGFNIQPRMELLLNRAFGDCDRIYLEPLGGGKDALTVFCVHAWLKKSIVGPRPLPFFIKTSEPKKTESELHNYSYYADFYIPFYLRPNVVPKRCVKIMGLSSIVGNFVEDSIPLRKALRSGQSPGIIFSLFENSLKGFRSQPDNGPSTSVESSLDKFIRDRAWTANIEPGVIRMVQADLKSTPTDIENRLCELVKGVNRRFSPYHGDLHAGNVMVRGRDAILIDFSAVKHGPLTADPATLEVSLVFGTDENDKPSESDKWKLVVDEIYTGVPIHQPPSLGTDPGPFFWLYKTVREVRHVLLGCDCMQEEAAAVLAAYLLRFARLKADKFDDDNLSKLALARQGYALVIAERIVTNLEGGRALKGCP